MASTSQGKHRAGQPTARKRHQTTWTTIAWWWRIQIEGARLGAVYFNSQFHFPLFSLIVIISDVGALPLAPQTKRKKKKSSEK